MSPQCGRLVALVLGPLAGLAAMGACATSDPDRLAKKDTTSSASAGSGGDGGAGSASVVASSASAGGSGPVEPDVLPQLTFVNGVVDEAAVRFCFVAASGPTTEKPWPSADGLAFARAGTLEPVALPAGDVAVKAVVGSAVAVGSKGCAALEASGSVRVLPLGVLPASALTEPRHLVVVATGCVGGAEHDDPQAALACGPGYAPDQPTAGLIAGYLSGLGAADAVRMQFVHGVAAMTMPAKVSLAPGVDSAEYTSVLPDWTLGAIAPNPPFDSESVKDFVNLAKAKLGVVHNGTPVEVPFSEILANGGVDATAIADGDGLTLVAVGARPGHAAGPWWRAFTAVAIHQPK